MSTITLEVPDELLQRIRAKARDAGQDSAAFTVVAILAGLDTLEKDADFPPDWYENLAPDVRAAYDAQIEVGLADLDAGRVATSEEVFARVQARHQSQTDAP